MAKNDPLVLGGPYQSGIRLNWLAGHVVLICAGTGLLSFIDLLDAFGIHKEKHPEVIEHIKTITVIVSQASDDCRILEVWLKDRLEVASEGTVKVCEYVQKSTSEDWKGKTGHFTADSLQDDIASHLGAEGKADNIILCGPVSMTGNVTGILGKDLKYSNKAVHCLSSTFL
jgi:NAD(P)H-flavin reductase